MNKIIAIIVALFFFATTMSAQAWWDEKKKDFTPGAKIALYEKWGKYMNYTPAETAQKAKAKFLAGPFKTVTVLNSGVDAKGNVNTLDIIPAQAVYLGNIPAGWAGKPNTTADMWLRANCGNGGFNNLKTVSEEIPAATTTPAAYTPPPPAPAAATKERLIWSQENSADGSYVKIYAEQNLDGSYTGNNRTVVYQAPRQYDVYTYHEVYITKCGRYFTVATAIVKPRRGRTVYGFGY